MLFPLSVCIALPSASLAKAQLSMDAQATDCKACHGDQMVLPSGHPPLKGQSLSDCNKCHQKDKSLRAKIPLSHMHFLSGVSCADCHKDPKKAEALDTNQCLACHDSPEKLAQATAHMKQENPHNSPHYGTTLDCNLCHLLHKKSENYCAQCHDWQLRVP